MAESEKGVRLAALPALDTLEFHAEFARRIAGLPDGSWVEIRIKR